MIDLNNLSKLNKKFYSKDVNIVAKKLLGKVLVHNIGETKLAGIIVEVEAYEGKTDRAAHTFIGKTKRNEIMFNEGGYLYVYFTYGVHFCCNVVTGKKDEGTAVLIRGIEPIVGIDKMEKSRFGSKNIQAKKIYDLTNGPGKICQAFQINKSHYGFDLTDDKIYLLNYKKIKDENIICTTRIGIKKSIDLPWRYYIKDNPFVSKK
ncbi:MAG: 3-methyladenine DNA glycosylase [Ignavibacteriales bacterium CG12_big_fil_rev_8_21_14_0_65_30_8]|nr:MAG: 3-methyladenine DNA glycosylase [Ignavibacteriales bacterium CG12_big_fil_rev_8_21_14_0_65_30_8]